MDDFDKTVLKKIADRGIVPRPYLYFFAKRSVFWTLAALAILLGAISFAVALFALEDTLRSGGKSMKDMPLDEFLFKLPYLWLAVFALFSASAYFGFKNTRHGYRYSFFRSIGLAGTVSIGLGLVLNLLNIGGLTNAFLTAHIPAYAAYTYLPFDEWRRPDQGQLGGDVLSVTDGQSLRLRDFNNKDWTVDISTSTIDVTDPLADEGDITIRGTRTGPDTFKASAIAAFN